MKLVIKDLIDCKLNICFGSKEKGCWYIETRIKNKKIYIYNNDFSRDDVRKILHVLADYIVDNGILKDSEDE